MATTLAGSALGGEGIRTHASFIWSVADLLRGDYKQSEDGKVILPLTVIRRLDLRAGTDHARQVLSAQGL